MDEYYVYKHTSPSNKVYIGITKNNPVVRWANGNGNKENKSFYLDILTYGWDNFEHEILYSGLDKRTCDITERTLIKSYNSTNPIYGYNRSLGRLHSKTSIEKMKESQKNRWKNKNKYLDYRQKQINKINKFNDIDCTVTNINNLLRNTSKTDNKKISNQKKVYCIELNKMFNSIYEASELTKIGYNSIIRCASGKQATAGKLRWLYKRDMTTEELKIAYNTI
jgi:hypothetical protein